MIKLLEIANNINQSQIDEGFREKALAAAVAAGMAYGGYKKYVPQEKPLEPTITTQIEKPKEFNFEDQFKKSTNSIIDYIEGAYVNPEQLKNKREKFAFRKSGETMFGIDRRTGGKINDTPAGKEFWKLIDIDKRKNPDKWKRYYDGGNIKDELKNLTVEMMKPRFMRLFNNNLDEKTQSLVKSDPRLFLHFAYAAWNGDGWFRRFAKSTNKRVKEGITDVDVLFNKAIEDRKNSSGLIGSKADEVLKAAESLY
jgi:hypothetical protein